MKSEKFDKDGIRILICEDCKKELTELTELKQPAMITKYDFEHNYKREKVYICCGKIRMVDLNNGELSSYDIPNG
jgi:hypothetical protein